MCHNLRGIELWSHPVQEGLWMALKGGACADLLHIEIVVELHTHTLECEQGFKVRRAMCM